MLTPSEEEPSLEEGSGYWVAFTLRTTPGTKIHRSVNYFIYFIFYSETMGLSTNSGTHLPAKAASLYLPSMTIRLSLSSGSQLLSDESAGPGVSHPFGQTPRHTGKHSSHHC
jgi:hypothetical protein